MQNLCSFLWRLLWEERGEVDVIADPAATDPAPASDPAPAATDPAPEPAAQPQDDIDPAFAGLDAAMKAVLPQDEPSPNAADPNAQSVTAFPESLASISPYVTDEASAQRAIEAASEVWGVAAGQIPARHMLEGFKAIDPQQYEAIAADLRDYLGVSAEPAQAADPFAALKEKFPQQFSAVSTWWKQQTGQDLGGAPDPRDQRLQALEQRYAQEEEQRNVAAHNAQVESARGKANEFMTAALKDHFAEGMQDRYLAPGTGLLWVKAQQMNIDPGKLQGELLSGKTDTLQKVWKAVEKDEVATIRRFNENIIKRAKTLQNAVPASKGKAQPIKQVAGAPVRKPGESDTAYAQRVWDSGFTA